MKFFIILALIGLSSQFITESLIQYNSIYPLKAVAILHGETKDQVTNEKCRILGSVMFEQFELAGNVTVTVDISGLPKHNIAAGVLRGLHIHTYGIRNVTDDIAAACASTGPHFNPTNESHGLLNSLIRHDADLGNVATFENGTIRAVLVSDRLEIFGPYSLLGRSVVLHQSEDDGGMGNTELSRSTGSSGARIACGVIGWEKSESNAVENGFLSYLVMNSTDLLLNTTQYMLNQMNSIRHFFMGFEDQGNKTVGQQRIVESDEEEEFDEEEPVDDSFNGDPVLFKLFYNYLSVLADKNKNETNATSNLLNSLKTQSNVDTVKNKLFGFFNTFNSQKNN